MNDILYFNIAGINFHATGEDVGNILGYTQPHPVEADPGAIGCFLQTGKLVGFIPKARQEEYKQFAKDGANEENQCLFSGNIKRVRKRDGSTFFVGNIALAKGDKLGKILENHYTKDFNIYNGQLL